MSAREIAEAILWVLVGAWTGTIVLLLIAVYLAWKRRGL